MALNQIEAEILWSERSADLRQILAGVRCRFEHLYEGCATQEITIEIVRINVRAVAGAERVNKRIIKDAWKQIIFCFEDVTSEKNIFSDVWVSEESQSLTKEQEASLQRELDEIERMSYDRKLAGR